MKNNKSKYDLNNKLTAFTMGLLYFVISVHYYIEAISHTFSILDLGIAILWFLLSIGASYYYYKTHSGFNLLHRYKVYENSPFVVVLGKESEQEETKYNRTALHFTEIDEIHKKWIEEYPNEPISDLEIDSADLDEISTDIYRFIESGEKSINKETRRSILAGLLMAKKVADLGFDDKEGLVIKSSLQEGSMFIQLKTKEELIKTVWKQTYDGIKDKTDMIEKINEAICK